MRVNWRGRPAPPTTEMSDSKQLSDVEYDEVMAFEGLRWPDVSFERSEENADAVFWFAPQAFYYYLPGFLTAGIREVRWNTNAYDSCIGMLDRSAQREYWDDFFEPRLTLLTRPVLRSVSAWLDWFEARLPDGFHHNSYDRSRDTLRLLAERCE